MFACTSCHPPMIPLVQDVDPHRGRCFASLTNGPDHVLDIRTSTDRSRIRNPVYSLTDRWDSPVRQPHLPQKKNTGFFFVKIITPRVRFLSKTGQQIR